MESTRSKAVRYGRIIFSVLMLALLISARPASLMAGSLPRETVITKDDGTTETVPVVYLFSEQGRLSATIPGTGEPVPENPKSPLLDQSRLVISADAASIVIVRAPNDPKAPRFASVKLVDEGQQVADDAFLEGSIAEFDQNGEATFTFNFASAKPDRKIDIVWIGILPKAAPAK